MTAVRAADVGEADDALVGRRSAARPRVQCGLRVVGTATLLAWLTPPVAGLRPHAEDVRDVWLYLAVLAIAVALTTMRAVVDAEDRLAWACFAAAGACWSAGCAYFFFVVRPQDPMPFPTLADAGFLAFYLPAWCGVVLLLRRRVRSLAAAVWLDGLIAGLAAAAVAAALVLQRVLDVTGGSFRVVATNLSYPVADLVLLALVVGVYPLFGWRPARVWLLLGLGLAAFAVADTVFLFRLASGSFVVGTTWDAGWPLGLAIVALAGWQRPPAAAPSVNLTSRLALLVPMGSSAIGLAVLVYGSVVRLHPVAVVLATGSVLGGLVRTALTLRELQTLGRVRHQALTDDLTGLANRRAFYDILGRALRDRPDDATFAVMLLDLDRFKQVNDSLGHHVGDDLIRRVGQRLEGALRAGDVLARLGGDEFGILVRDVDGPGAAATAKRLRDVLLNPFAVSGATLHLDASLGVTLCPEHGDDVDTLMRRADIAMYESKGAGNGWQTYTPDRDDRFVDRLATTEALRAALRGDELVLHYQPKLTLATGDVTGVEALVRWQHPERGLVYPDDFLPLAEAVGLMDALTTVVLDQALRRCAAWRAEGRELTVAVNLSASNLLDAELPGVIAALLANLALPPSALQLEITETVLMRDPQRSLPVLEQLNTLGVRLAIDDYGTGYSSLTYLSTLPIHDLKLDKSFVMAMADEGDAARRASAIVRSTVTLARALGLDLIAEGVESAAVLQQIHSLGCTIAQGYYLSQPLPAAEMTAWMDAWAESRAWLAAEPEPAPDAPAALAEAPPSAEPAR